MFRPAVRFARPSALRCLPRASAPRRFLSTAPPAQKSRSWKSSAARWGLAIGAVYYYNTSNIFAEEPAFAAPPSISVTDHETETLPTLDSITAHKQRRIATTQPVEAANATTTAATPTTAADGEVAMPGSPEDLEEEADQQGAFNPETGEINWDCPCLGGMAHGPCGEQFKAAFSCFVYSKEEPKGIDCIDRFKGMQDCFREHPDIYGAEIDDEDEGEGEGEGEGAPAPATDEGSSESGAPTLSNMESHPAGQAEKVADAKPHKSDPEQAVKAKQDRAKKATQQVKQEHEPQSESEAAVPKAWHDSTPSK